MTQKRDFKKLVRARMERTGESYMSARRVVVSDGTAQAPEDDSLRVARSVVARAIEAEPRLTLFGLGVWDDRRTSRAEVKRRFDLQRASLLNEDGVAQVATCLRWLRKQSPIKTLNRGRDSYSYKHMVERWTRATGEEQYIGNGALIAAAIGLGLNYAPSGPRSPNIRLGISERRLKIVLEEAGHPLQAK